MKKNISVLALMAVLAIASPARAGLEEDVYKGIQQAQGSVPTQNTAVTDSTDRKDNAGDAGDRGGAGQKAAALAGTIMVTTGFAMLPNPLTAPTGWSLIAKGMTEFAQAAAMRDSKDSNYGQKSLLSNPDGNTGKQETGGGPASAPTLPSEVQQILAQNGVNPDDFAKQAYSGDLKSTDDFRRAMGDKTDISPEDLAKGDAEANQRAFEIASGAKEGPGTSNPEALKFDESNSSKTGGGDGTNSAANGALANSFSSFDGKNKIGVSSGADGSGEASNGRNVASVSPDASGLPIDGKLAPGAGNVFDSLLASLAPGASALEKRFAIAEFLGGLGVQLPSKGLNIFQKAGGKFRSFEKWRTERSVVSAR